MVLQIKTVEHVSPQSGYTQDIFRFDKINDALTLRLALNIPDRLEEDRKAASQKQRSTLHSFYYENDLLPANCGWQQASVLLNIRALSYAVSETLEDGFRAERRILIAPLITAYVSQRPYLCAVARGWSLGSWPAENQGSVNRNGSPSWFTLIASPFYEELFNFAEAARGDLNRAIGELPSQSETAEQDGEAVDETIT